eukprot:scaffold1227_cov111-Isochrysis_galbana.AAC.6
MAAHPGAPSAGVVPPAQAALVAFSRVPPRRDLRGSCRLRARRRCPCDVLALGGVADPHGSVRHLPGGRDLLLRLACSGHRRDRVPSLRRGLRGRCLLLALRQSRCGQHAPSGGGAEVAGPHGP